MAAPKPVLEMKWDRIKVLSGTSNFALTSDVCECLAVQPGDVSIKRFADGEIHLQILENVRGVDAFAVQPTCSPVEGNLFELLLMIDALKRASAGRITAVFPYYGYARQDRKDRPRVPISAKLVASLLERAGADRVLAVDLHAAQIQGFFDIPVDHLFASPVMIEHFRAAGPNVTVVSPDAGGVERARAFAKRLNAPLAIIDKRREQANVAEVMNIIGDVRGRNCIMVDDLIDTAGTLVKGCRGVAEGGRGKCFGVRHACCAVRAGGKQDQESQVEGSSSHEFDSACATMRGRCERIRVLVGCPAAGAGHSVHPRRRLDQHAFRLTEAKEQRSREERSLR